MWIVYSLLSAILFSSMWLLIRATRGVPGSIVSAATYAAGPIILLFTLPGVALPWSEPIWYWFLLVSGLMMAIASWTVMRSLQEVPVTVSNPLLGLSAVAALITATLFFDGRFTIGGVAGIIMATAGLFLLYHGRWKIWKTIHPWLILGVVTLFGVSGTIMHRLLEIFPNPLIVSAIFLTANCVLPLAHAVRSGRRISWSWNMFLILLTLACVTVGQDLLTLYAMQLAPAPYVLSVKRTSVLFGMLGGYFLFRERETSLSRLLLSALIVMAGVVMMTVG